LRRRNNFIQGDGLTWFAQRTLEAGVRQSDLLGETTRPGFSREQIDQVLERGGKLSLAQLVCCQAVYFSASVAFGSRAFIERMEPILRQQFGLKRERQPQPIKEAEVPFHVFQRGRGTRLRTGPPD